MSRRRSSRDRRVPRDSFKFENRSKKQLAMEVLLKQSRLGGKYTDYMDGTGLSSQDINYYKKKTEFQAAIAAQQEAQLVQHERDPEAADDHGAASADDAASKLDDDPSVVYKSSHRRAQELLLMGGTTRNSVAKKVKEEFGSGAVSHTTVRRIAESQEQYKREHGSPAPIVDPRPTGPEPKVPNEIVKCCRDFFSMLREMKYKVVRPMVVAYLMRLVTNDSEDPDNQLAQYLRTGVKSNTEDRSSRGTYTKADWWYWKHFNENGSIVVRSLSVVRAQWSTSDNARIHYDVTRDVLLKTKIAVPNADFDASFNPCKDVSPYQNPFDDPRCHEIIIVKPARLFSYDETDFSLDTTDPARGNTDTTWRSSSDDDGETFTNKNCEKTSGAGGCNAAGCAIPPFVCFKSTATPPTLPVDSILDSTTLEYKGPQGSLFIRKDGQRVLAPAKFYANAKASFNGTVTLMYLKHLHSSVDPPPSQEDPVVLMCDGVRTHLNVHVLSWARENYIHIILRIPNCTHLVQPEDVLLFRVLKSDFRAAIALRLNEKVQAFVNSPAGRNAVPAVGHSELLELLKVPWTRAFSKPRIIKSWAMVGVVPFSRRVEWTLKEEESRRVQKSSPDTRTLIANASAVSQRHKKKFTTVDLSGDSPVAAGAPVKKRKKRLHALAWRCEGGATADGLVDQLLEIDRQEKEDECAKKEAAAQREAARVRNKQELRALYDKCKDTAIDKLTAKKIRAHLLVRHTRTFPSNMPKAALLKHLNDANTKLASPVAQGGMPPPPVRAIEVETTP